jgi:hypothetical protein
MHLQAALSFVQAIWEALQSGRPDLAEDCAFQAWAALQASKAEDPTLRYQALFDQRYGAEAIAPRLRLVVDNTP